MEEFDIISPGDQAALLAVSTPEFIGLAKTALVELGYKVHVVENFEQFELRYNQINYQIVVIEETFAGSVFFRAWLPVIRASWEILRTRCSSD